jgi:hypothetical protein
MVRAHSTIGRQIKPTERSSRPIFSTAGEVITKEPRTEGTGHTRSVQGEAGLPCIRWDYGGADGPVTISTNTTHVDFGFAHYRYAIFVLHWLTSREWDAEVRENGALRRRKEIVCDESYSLDGGVRSKMVAHR